MSHDIYLDLFNQTDWCEISSGILKTEKEDVERALLREGKGGLEDFITLISPIAGEYYLESLASLSNQLTKQRFGKAIRLFAPMYLSNECNNVCDYCGFSLGNTIPRKTLNPVEILKDAGILRKMGFEHVLLVTGESARVVDVKYIGEALQLLRPHFSNLSIEVQPLHQNEYEELIEKGLHSVFVYQETYNRESYSKHHKKGKKRRLFR